VGENLMNSAHKASTPVSRAEYDRIFRGGADLKFPEEHKQDTMERIRRLHESGKS